MKKRLLSALLLAGTSLALFSCNNGDYTATPAGGTTWNGTGNVSSGTITAKINGTQWSGTGSGTNAGSMLLMGMSADGKIMTLNIKGFSTAQAYTISSTGSSAAWATTAGASTSATSGTITVTSYQNSQIQGTFQWDGNGLSVTNGAFNLPVH